MLAAFLFLAQSAAPETAATAAKPAPFAPQRATSADMQAAFPDAWRLPRVDRAGQPLPSAGFEARLLRLAAEPLAAGDAASGRPSLMLGDLLRRARAAARAGTVQEARAQLDALLSEAKSAVPPDKWPDVRELLDLRDFVSPTWDPDDADERDGFLAGPVWQLPVDCWPSHKGDRDVVQLATFMAADLAAIKTCEADFPRYFEYPGHNYEKVAPLPGSYLALYPAQEQEAAGLPCGCATRLITDFAVDLPFPFGGYAMRLHMLNGLDEAGRLMTWVYSASPSFHWMAGYDLYEPVQDGSGAFVGMLIVRQLGLDIDDVPDQPKHRAGGARSVLGGLRRQAEARFDARGASQPFPGRGAVPVAPVRAVAD